MANAYCEIVFLGGTYKLTNNNLTVMIFAVMGSEKQTEISGVALTVSEDKETFTWLLETFKSFIKDPTKINIFMTDKDLTQRDVLYDVFFGIQVYLCRYHVLKIFSKQINVQDFYEEKQHDETAKYLKLKRDETVNILESLHYSESSAEYNSNYELLQNIMPKKLLEYYNKNWHCIQNEWATYLMDENFGNFTNNRVECINKHVKDIEKKNSTMYDFIVSFLSIYYIKKLKYMQELDINT